MRGHLVVNEDDAIFTTLTSVLNIVKNKENDGEMILSNHKIAISLNCTIYLYFVKIIGNCRILHVDVLR